MICIASWLVLLPVHSLWAPVRKIYNKLSAYLYWNNLIVAIMESILIIAFVGFIKVKYYMRFDTYGEEIQSGLTLACMVGYVVIPTIALGKLMRNFSLAEEGQF
mmetsp:Transcript_1153/g.1523  ORF Transcript_1153/g.1523 Transcript_1153/m.1523 type:complete len:104 (-) Transcript_1153:1482-1793(-)